VSSPPQLAFHAFMKSVSCRGLFRAPIFLVICFRSLTGRRRMVSITTIFIPAESNSGVIKHVCDQARRTSHFTHNTSRHISCAARNHLSQHTSFALLSSLPLPTTAALQHISRNEKKGRNKKRNQSTHNLTPLNSPPIQSRACSCACCRS